MSSRSVILQRFDVDTNIPFNVREYQYCISCGQANVGHPIDNVLECITLRNGIQKNQFGKLEMVNLNTQKEAGDQNYPSD